MSAGIVRIQIESTWRDWRTDMVRNLAPVANDILRQAFASIGLGLASGETSITCTKEQAQARYDWQEGIDVLLYFQQGGKATLQEKYLTYPMSTLTFEEHKTSGALGAWYYCTAQYYFVGYAREYKDRRKPVLAFQDWMLVDFAGLKRASALSLVPWEPIKQNRHDNRRATFRYVYFDNVPTSCIIGRKNRKAQMDLF